MTIIDIYLAHRDSIKFIENQVLLIRKYFKINEGSQINIFGYVDGNNETIKNQMREIWIKLGTTPIEIPNIIDGYNRDYISSSESFGLAFTYVYQNYILKNDNISICIENDIFPFKDIQIEEYINNYEICGEVRFNAAQLPDRNVMFWLGFIIFNGQLMKDRELFSGLCKPITNIESGRSHWIDCGGQSYYWIKKNERTIRQMVTNGNESYDGFTSLECTPHNITDDIQHLPEIFRDGYQSYYRVLVYDNCLIHLERMGKENDDSKEKWWNHCFEKIYNNNNTIYIPIGFQCTSAEILKKQNKRICSFPFDWIISNPDSIITILSMLLENYNIKDLVINEFLKIDNILSFLKQEEFIINPNGNILLNSKYNFIFPHIEYSDETILKCIERFERLKNYILFSKNIKFVFINRLVNNSNIEKSNDKIIFSINGIPMCLNIIENFIKLNNLLLKHISPNRYSITIINAVEQLNNDIVFDKNIIYKELIPSNNNNLTDEEIMQINI